MPKNEINSTKTVSPETTQDRSELKLKSSNNTLFVAVAIGALILTVASIVYFYKDQIGMTPAETADTSGESLRELTPEQTNEATVVPEMTIAEKYSQLESLSASEVTTEVEAREQVLDSLESTQETSPETRQKKIDILDTL